MPTEAMPQSPFLPGTKIQFAWDSTSLSYLKTCPRMYQYTMIDGWVPKDESIHLRFGGEFHSVIQDYENLMANGSTFEDAVRNTVHLLLIRIHDWDPDPTLKAYRHKNKAQLVYLAVAYLDEFRDDPCKTFILENGKPAIELSFRFQLDFGPSAGIHPRHSDPDYGVGPMMRSLDQPYLLCGHLDRVVTYADSLFVLDHKTTTTTPTDYFFNQFSPNNQMTLYSFAGKVVLDAPIAGVIVEGLQVTNEAPMKFERRPTYRSDEVIDEWLDDLEYHLANAEAFATANYWPQNDTACGNYGGCRFREVCSRPKAVRERFLKSDFTQLPEDERWNPLKSR
jgi:PD-(D/E)XK nuclease superfamily